MDKLKLIKPITSDHDLIELANHLDIHIDGIFTINEIKKPLPRKGSYIILLGHEGEVGHWTCIHDNQFFDSIGQGAPTILGDLPYNEFQYQSTYAEYCGVWCIFWLYIKQKNHSDLLRGFTDLNINAI